MNLPKFLYWFSTAFLCLLLFFSVSMYFFSHSDVVVAFRELGYPAYLIYPLAIAKLLAAVAILSNKSRFLKHLAYAGLFFNFFLALLSHLARQDGRFLFALIALLLLALSFVMDKILYPGSRKRSGYEL